MKNEITIKPIAHIYTDFPEKFGVPRQSGLVNCLEGKIIFEPEYRVREAFRELDGFSHIWLIWQFSKCENCAVSPTVRPPRLGGNKRVGVFASRSPFRPNSLGLSCVKIEKIDFECKDAPVIFVSGIDMISGTPIFDIKPYVPAADIKADAKEGYTEFTKDYEIELLYDGEILKTMPKEKAAALLEALRQDPRPSYKDESGREYGMLFAGYNVKFIYTGSALKITEIERSNKADG